MIHRRLSTVRALLVGAACTFSAIGAASAQADGASSQDARIEALASELARMRESLSIPEDDAKRSQFGLGPAASKVYSSTGGVSIGGYGQFNMGHSLGADDERAPHSGDVHRFILYVGHKFSDRVVMNSELEFEHGTTGSNKANGESGSVSVEFVYLDFLLSQYVNIRTGLLLMPMGIYNEMHEPTTYNANLRPETEKRIIPSTWREAGVGLFGEVGGGLSYKLYVVNGLAGVGFDNKGVRGGRQKGNHFVWEDKGVALALDWKWGDAVNLGASAYTGGADHDPTGTAEVSNTVFEGHGIFRLAGAELRALYARGQIDGADEVGALQGAADPVPVPEAQTGFYVEVAYDVLPVLADGLPQQSLSPYLRFEKLNLNAEVADTFEADDKLDTTEITGGVAYKPHPDVVVKGEFHQKSDSNDDSPDVKGLRFGAGFIF